jgi:phage I-like protein
MYSLFSPDFKLPEDGFIHLAPLGEFRRRVVMPDGAVRDITQVVDAAAVEAMAADLANRASLKDWPGILLDADHGANKPDGSSRAFGWITSAQARPDGLWGKVRWTKTGADAVAGGEFRFVSPTWRLGIELQEIAPDRFRPVALWRCSVTNDAWFVERGPGMVPIAARAAVDAPAAACLAHSDLPSRTGDTCVASIQPKDPQPMNKLLSALGLKPDATEDQALAALNTIIANRASAAVTAAADSSAAIVAAEAQADKDLLEFRAFVEKLPDAERQALRAGLVANRAAVRASLVLAARAADPIDPAQAQVPHRAAAANAPVTAESAKAEFAKDADLQAEFRSVGGEEAYVAYRLATVNREEAAAAE